MTKRRRLPGTRWRFLAHEAPTEPDGMYGASISYRSEDHSPSVFDEIVVDSWLHAEQLDTNLWIIHLAGITIHATINPDGSPRHVTVEGPEHSNQLPKCSYRLHWGGLITTEMQ